MRRRAIETFALLACAAGGASVATAAAHAWAAPPPMLRHLRSEFAGCRMPAPTRDRGVVVCAGGRRLLACAFATVAALRRLGCDLPVEIVHAGREELDGDVVAAFATRFGEGVRFVDAAVTVPWPCHPPENLRGFSIKPYALLITSFARALLLDADCAPLRDPTYLFECEAFRRHGNVFWPDFWSSAELVRPWVARELRLRAEPRGFETESGQAVIDKARCERALKWAWILNNHQGAFYRLYNGDKDLYRLAFRLAGQPFYQVPFAPGLLGTLSDEGLLLLDTMVQKCPRTGRALFAHRTMHKRLGCRLRWTHWNLARGERGARSVAAYVPGRRNFITAAAEVASQTRATPAWVRRAARAIQADEDEFATG